MLIPSKKNGHFEVGTKGCWDKSLYKCLQHYFNAFKIALVKLRECSAGCGKRNAVGIAGGWSKSLSGGQLLLGVDQGARGAAHFPP